MNEQEQPAVAGPVEPTVMQRAWVDCAAFPIPLDDRPGAYPAEPGMSLRDYFAIHSTQPGMAEIAKAAGVGMDKNRRIYTSADATTGIHFDEWWQTLTLARQCELSALVRYAQADAMMVVRAA